MRERSGDDKKDPTVPRRTPQGRLARPKRT